MYPQADILIFSNCIRPRPLAKVYPEADILIFSNCIRPRPLYFSIRRWAFSQGVSQGGHFDFFQLYSASAFIFFSSGGGFTPDGRTDDDDGRTTTTTTTDGRRLATGGQRLATGGQRLGRPSTRCVSVHTIPEYRAGTYASIRSL